MTMQKKITLIFTLSLLALMPLAATASQPKVRAEKNHIEELMQRRRWGEARSMLQQLATSLDEVRDGYDIEWVDYKLICCAVELGASDVDDMMTRFVETYPQSRYNNSILYTLGSYYCDEGDLKRAKQVYATVEYKHLDAHQKERFDIRMGYIHFADGEYNDAYPYFVRIKESSQYYPHALYFLSYIAYSKQEYEEAADGFTKLKDNDDYGRLVPYYLLQIEYRNQNYNYVADNGENLLNSATDEVRDDLVRVMAESFFEAGDYAQALRYISQYPAELMGRQENYIKGYSLYRLAMHEQAIAPLAAACGKRDLLTQNASYHLGDCYLKVGDKSHAADAFAMASAEGFDESIARYSLLNYGRLKFELGGGTFNESINVLNSYLERYPDSPYTADVKKLLIAAYDNAKNYDAAYSAIKTYNNPDGEIKRALQRLSVYRAIEAIKLGEWTSAGALLDEAEQLNVDPKFSALTIYWQGEVAYANGDMELAKQKYGDYIRRAPKTEKEYVMAQYGLGYANFALEDMESAEKHFENFVRDYAYRDNYMYDAHNRLGDARFAMRKFGPARKAYNISVAGETAERNYARYQIALIDGVEVKNDDKIEHLKSIVSDGEGDYVDDAWYELGRTYIGLQRYDEGAKTLSDFIATDSLSPFYVDALSNLGLAYYNLDRKGDARRCYERIVEFDPQSSKSLEAIRSIREIYVSEGNIDEYFAYAERNGVQSDMSAAARDSLTFAAAKNCYLEGNKAVATSKLKNYLNSFTNGYNRSEALYYLSDCHVDANDYEAAAACMEELMANGNTMYTERVVGIYAPMTFNMQRYDKSAMAYRRLYDLSRDVDTRMHASEGYVEATLLSGDKDAIKLMVDDVALMDDATASAWAKRRSTLVKANILREEGDMEGALVYYGHLASNRSTAEGTEAYYYLVLDKFNKGDYATAEQMVYDLGMCGSMYWQAKCFLVLGDIFVALDNSFQARATYQSIVDGYSPKDDGIVEEAQQRINSLK